MSAQFVNLERQTLAELMTCPLCDKIFTKATSIMECLHTFCRECIHKKIKDEELDHCPVCEIDLGASPLDKLMHNHLKESLRLTIFGTETNNAQPIAEQPVPPVTLPETSREISTSPLIPNPSESVPQPDLHHSFLVEHPVNNVDDSHESAQAEIPDSNPDPELVRPSTGLVQMANQPNSKESNAGSSLDPVNKEGYLEKDRAQENVGSSGASDAKLNPIWFSLTAAQNVEYPLPQIPKPYMKIEDGSLRVATLKKYVAQKLGLAEEVEVEIFLGGYPMNSTVQLKELLEWWLNNSSEHSQPIQTSVGSSGKDFVMPLTYGRKSG